MYINYKEEYHLTKFNTSLHILLYVQELNEFIKSQNAAQFQDTEDLQIAFLIFFLMRL